MPLDRRRVLIFLAWLIPLFAVFMLAYRPIAPFYQHAVLAGANAVAERLPPPLRIEVLPEGGWQYFEVRGAGWMRPQIRWDAMTPHYFLLGLAILPALLLATPAPWRMRLKLLGIGLILLYVAQVIAVVGLIRATHCLRIAPGTRHCLLTLRVVYTSGQISAAAIWALLSWRYWFPKR